LQCDQFLEDNEDNINDWYFNQEKPGVSGLQETVCTKTLSNADAKCLSEPYGETIKSPQTESKEEAKSNGKRKGESGKIEL